MFAYHGWKFDGAGHCLEMPAEPAEYETQTARQGPSLPRSRNWAGWCSPIWAPNRHRCLPATTSVRVGQLSAGRRPGARSLQLAPDHGEQRRSLPPRIASRTSTGGSSGGNAANRRRPITPGSTSRSAFDVFRYGIIKRRVLEGNTEDDDDWNVGHPLIFPAMLRVGRADSTACRSAFPLTTTHTWHLWYACYRVPTSNTKCVQQTEIPLYDVPWRDERESTSSIIVDGQDIMACRDAGAGGRSRRARPGSSDEGIVLLRRLLFEQVDRVQTGSGSAGRHSRRSTRTT